MSAQSHVPGVAGSIAVVIPALHADRYLAQAVASIVGDIDAPAALEVIVVFDGAMPSESHPWMADPRVTIAATGKRSGSGNASNHAASLTQAEFIARMDADDLSLPGRLSQQLRYLSDNTDVVLLGTSGTTIDANGEVLAPYPSGFGDDVRSVLLRRNPIIHSSVVMRRTAFDQVGGYDPTCIRMQDYHLCLRLAQLGRVAVLEDVLLQYRVHDGQTSRTPSGFVELMRKLSFERRSLARRLGAPLVTQAARDSGFVFSQLIRYSGMRRPRYLTTRSGKAGRPQ
jgi:glycosyltransferase involved in cell wall biosynthesis